jgi:hypothetical protein
MSMTVCSATGLALQPAAIETATPTAAAAARSIDAVDPDPPLLDHLQSGRHPDHLAIDLCPAGEDRIRVAH